MHPLNLLFITMKKSIFPLTILTVAMFALVACEQEAEQASAPAEQPDQQKQQEQEQEQAEFADISKEKLKAAIEANEVTVIDVNGTDSYKEGHIPSAIDFVAYEDNLAEVLPEDKDSLIVAYCGNEYCSAYKMAAKKAKELGYTNVKHFSGGLQGWKSAGEKTESAS